MNKNNENMHQSLHSLTSRPIYVCVCMCVCACACMCVHAHVCVCVHIVWGVWCGVCKYITVYQTCDKHCLYIDRDMTQKQRQGGNSWIWTSHQADWLADRQEHTETDTDIHYKYNPKRQRDTTTETVTSSISVLSHSSQLHLKPFSLLLPILSL